MVVYVSPEYRGHDEGPGMKASCGTFPELARRCHSELKGTGVDMLAFHRYRTDSGPGCSDDVNDAAHFTVRSPYPTLQLLLQKDLEHARSQWADTDEGRRSVARGLPGALGLLQQNKQRLRRLGYESVKKFFVGLERK